MLRPRALAKRRDVDLVHHELQIPQERALHGAKGDFSLDRRHVARPQERLRRARSSIYCLHYIYIFYIDFYRDM